MNIRAAPPPDAASDISSIASDRDSRHDYIEFQQYGTAHGFDMLQDSDTSRTSHSGGSTLSSYADAPGDGAAAVAIGGHDDSQDGHSIEQLRQHLMSPSSSSAQGLVPVTPIKAASPPHSQSRRSFVSALHVHTPGVEDVAASSAFMLSPQTPRHRGRPGAPAPAPPPPPPPPAARPPDIPPDAAREDRAPASPLQRFASQWRAPRSPRAPPGRPPPTAKPKPAPAGANRHDGVRESGQMQLSFGQPRQVSDSRSLQSQGSLVSDDGHIEPSRRVAQPTYSYIKRSGPTISSKGPYLAGLPRLPTFPVAAAPRGNDFELEKRDLWGRRQAPPRVAWTLLVLCAAFPPLWLLLGAGYFDSLCGVLPRSVKLTAMLLALCILAAVIALVTAFGVLRT